MEEENKTLCALVDGYENAVSLVLADVSSETSMKKKMTNVIRGGLKYKRYGDYTIVSDSEVPNRFCTAFFKLFSCDKLFARSVLVYKHHSEGAIDLNKSDLLKITAGCQFDVKSPFSRRVVETEKD